MDTMKDAIQGLAQTLGQSKLLPEVLAERAEHFGPPDEARITEQMIVDEIDAILDRQPDMDMLISGRAALIYPDGAHDEEVERALQRVRDILGMGSVGDSPLTLRERIAYFREKYVPADEPIAHRDEVKKIDGNVIFLDLQRLRRGRSPA